MRDSLKKKKSTCNARVSGHAGWILGSGRFSGGGHGNPLQYSGLENPMDCIVHMDTTEHGTQHIPTIYKADNKDLQYSPGNYPRYPVTPSCGESEKEGIYM